MGHRSFSECKVNYFFLIDKEFLYKKQKKVCFSEFFVAERPHTGSESPKTEAIEHVPESLFNKQEMLFNKVEPDVVAKFHAVEMDLFKGVISLVAGVDN